MKSVMGAKMASFRPLAVRPMAVLLPMLGGSKRSQGRAPGQRRGDKTEWNGSNTDCTVIAHDDRGDDTYQRCSRVAWLMLMVALMERMCGRGKEELAGEVGRFCRLEHWAQQSRPRGGKTTVTGGRTERGQYSVEATGSALV